MEWQLIDTAPKDGTVVILHADGNVNAGWWHPHVSGGIACNWCFVDDTELDEYEKVTPNAWMQKHSPTHWMPLPPHPTK